MKKLFLVLTFVPAFTCAGAAFAQEKEFNLKVTGADAQLIGEGLGSLPFVKVAPLMSKLQVQINAQTQTEAPKDEAPAQGQVSGGTAKLPAVTPKN